MMNIVISGGGMVGMTLAHLLRRRGFEPVVVERMREGEYVPRGYMMGFQGFPPLEEIGLMGEIRAAGWDIAPREDGSTVAIAVNIETVLHTLARDLPVLYEHTVVELVTDADGRTVGVVVEGPGGGAPSSRTSWWRATASCRPCGTWRGWRPRSPSWRTPRSRS